MANETNVATGDAAGSVSASDSASPTDSQPIRTIDLRDPFLALFLAWLIPGAGHFYQRRFGKGGLFMVCVLGTFVAGLIMGQGRVVYASWRQGDERYPYVCQVAVGLPSLPALVQAMRQNSVPPKAPWFDGFEAPPLMYGQRVDPGWAKQQIDAGAFTASDFTPQLDVYMPVLGQNQSSRVPAHERYNQLSDWNLKLGAFFELGTVYTVIAGLLNVLAMYDAWGGPAFSKPHKEKEPAPA